MCSSLSEWRRERSPRHANFIVLQDALSAKRKRKQRDTKSLDQYSNDIRPQTADREPLNNSI
jgi:hypothetical protein